MSSVKEEVQTGYEKYLQDEQKRRATYEAYKLQHPKPKIKLGDIANIYGYTESKLMKTKVVKVPEVNEYEMWIDCMGDGGIWTVNTVSLDYNTVTGEWFMISKEEALKRGLRTFER